MRDETKAKLGADLEWSAVARPKARPEAPLVSQPVRRAWAPALLFVAVIAWESTVLGSSQETVRLLYPIVSFFGLQITMAQILLLNALLRKAGHFAGYAILSLLMLRAWWATLILLSWAPRLPSWRAILHSWRARAAGMALLTTILIAALDEWHQTTLPGRTGTIHDVALDSMAAACAQLILIAFSDARGRYAALKEGSNAGLTGPAPPVRD